MPRLGSTRARIWAWVGIPLVAIVIVAGGIATVRQARTIASLHEQLAARASENAQLLRRVNDLTRAQGAPAAEPAPAVHAPGPATHTAAAESIAAAEQRAERLHESLAQSGAEAAQLRTKVADLESRIETSTADNHRLSTQLEEGARNLADFSQTIETLRAQLKVNGGHVAELETASSRLKEEAAAGKRSAVETQQTVADLESVFHRREMYLNDILRRYKEITEQYRALSGVRDSRDRQAGAVSSGEVSRIQNSIALAEEDLKQIYALSAQAQRLQKKLPVK
jgi:DNA repair exonuclease SbcCD ATPase subunit